MYIAVDLGGTNTRIARFTDTNSAEMVDGAIRRPNTHVYEDDLAFIIKTARSLGGGSPIEGLGIGVPGNVTDDKTGMTKSNNLPEWANRSFAPHLATALNCPIYLDNDGVAAGLGEGYFGSIRGDFHYVIWGTGISCVYVSRSKQGDVSALYTRPSYRALFEAWEQECSGSAILRKFGKPGQELTADEWIGINTLFTDYLRAYVAAAKPQAIVFGGGLAIRHAETIMAHAAELDVAVGVTEFVKDGGLVGGLALIRRGMTAAGKS